MTHLKSIFLGEGNGTPLQYSCLENPMDRGAWWAAVHGVAKNRTRLSDFTFTCFFYVFCLESYNKRLYDFVKKKKTYFYMWQEVSTMAFLGFCKRE